MIFNYEDFKAIRHRHVHYGFPMVALAPGEARTVEVELRGTFRPHKLLLVGQMDVIRGHYKIKRARLPPLDRDDVVAYSTITRRAHWRKTASGWARVQRSIPGRTVIEYRGVDRSAPDEIAFIPKSFTRHYLPSSVEYIAVDPLSYVYLLNVDCDAKPQMPAIGRGASALFFGTYNIGNSVPLETAKSSVSLTLENVGDVVVRVYASVIGIGEWETAG